MKEIDDCQQRDLKWFTIVTVAVFSLLIIVNVPLLRFVPHEYFGSLNNLFIIQIAITAIFFFTPRITKLYGTFASLFCFIQCFILMVSENKLRTALLNENSPDHNIALNERMLVMVFLICFFFNILVQIISRQVMRRHFTGRFGFCEHNLMPNRSFFEFMDMQKSVETMNLESQLIASFRPYRD